MCATAFFVSDVQYVAFVVGMATGATVQALVVIAWMWLLRPQR